jgi:hypothetical protein
MSSLGILGPAAWFAALNCIVTDRFGGHPWLL